MNTAQVIQLNTGERVVASVQDGFDMSAQVLTDTLARPNIRLCGQEYQMIHAVMSKTIRYHKAMDWISNSQLAELTGISEKNISRIKKKLIEKKVLIKNRREIGINMVVSEWSDLPKNVKTEENKKRQNGSVKTSIRSFETSKLTEKNVKTDPYNIKTTKHKTNNTLDIETPKPKAKSKKTRISEDFAITPEMQKWVDEFQASKNVVVDLESETANFVDHWLGKGETRACWIASWRTWMRNSVKFNRSPSNQPPTKPRFQKPNSDDAIHQHSDHGFTTVGGHNATL